jgi:serine/threonine-protein kinase
LHPLIGLALLAGLLVGMFVIAKLNDLTCLFRRVPFTESPDALAYEARQVIQRLGHGEDLAVDYTYGFAEAPGVLTYLKKRDATATRWDPLASGQPAAMYFWYRQSPRQLTQRLSPADPLLFSMPGRVTPTEPPHHVPGMVTIFLDLKGRLIGIRAVPSPIASTAAASQPNWQPLLESAGLQWSDFQDQQVAPRYHPPMFADARMAWVGVYPDQPEIKMRVEAAACDGQAVFFQVYPDEGTPLMFDGSQFEEISLPYMFLVGSIVFLTLTGGAWLAWQNWRLGRANLVGASRLAAVLFACYLMTWLLLAHHSFSFGEEYFGLFVPMVGRAVQATGLTWLMYLALEPYVRRRWPWRIVSWNRLLAGRFRDPLVGRDILIGGLATVVSCTVEQLGHSMPQWLKLMPEQPLAFVEMEVFTNPLGVIIALPTFVLPAMATLFMILLLVVLLRREWLGVVAWFAIVMTVNIAGGMSIGYEHLTFFAAVAAFDVAMKLFLLLRFGFLTLAASHCFILVRFPLTTDTSAWYCGAVASYALVLGGIAIYSFVISLGGRANVGHWLGEE